MVVRPRFQNPESIISTSAASALGAVGVNNPSTEGRPVLTINGKVVYYPGEPVRGDVKVIRNINLPFTSDSVPLYFDDNCNKPFKAKESQSFEIEVRGVRGFATKLENAKKADSDSVYRDGTTFNDGDTVWHWLEPISDLQVEDNGDIQINEGVLPIQGHPQDKYEAMKFSGGEELTADNFQAIKVMNEYVLKDMERSAVVMESLINGKTQEQRLTTDRFRQRMGQNRYNQKKLHKMAETKHKRIETIGE